MAQIKINGFEDESFRVNTGNPVGFEVDKEGQLYLVHGEGISRIFDASYAGKLTTETLKFSNNIWKTKPLPKGTKIEITI